MNIFQEIESIFKENGIPFSCEYIESENRWVYKTDEEMIDAGITPDNVMLDFILNEHLECLFLGMIRIPHSKRGLGIGAKLVKALKIYVKEKHWVIILESAPENLTFWQKMHFSTFLFESYGFYMMGYGAKNKLYYKVKWQQLRKELYSKV
jgi:GNAT superfamily N-acetyltransferase